MVTMTKAMAPMIATRVVTNGRLSEDRRGLVSQEEKARHTERKVVFIAVVYLCEFLSEGLAEKS